MALQLTNSLTRKLETFQPITPNEVKMYVCGPTVYNYIHVGNARPLIFFDVVRRFLEFSGYKVTYVMNYTDVDDKIIARAKEEKVDASEITEKYIKAYEADRKALGVRTPHCNPKVTDYVPQIVSFIEKLIEKGAAYSSGEKGREEVFFSVKNFPEYGKLSGKKVEDLLVGVRVDPNEKKQAPADFSLWKPRKEESETSWDSPWGKGRPGWHIECSVMAKATLGETVDIHGGGMDLIHPHHENEVAQSEAYTGKLFAKYWMHNNMLNFGSEKMSKSLGNVVLAKTFIEQYGPELLKFLILSSHYRSIVDFSEKHIGDCQSGLHRFYTLKQKCEKITANLNAKQQVSTADETALLGQLSQFSEEWKASMDQDFNTAKLMGTLFELIRALNAYFDKKGFQATQTSLQIARLFLDKINELGGVLNLFLRPSGEFLTELKQQVCKDRGITVEQISKAIDERAQAKQEKNYARADELRKQLHDQRIDIRDTPSGTEWDVRF